MKNIPSNAIYFHKLNFDFQFSRMRFGFSVLVQKIIVFESAWLTKSYLQS